jgi:hypothetical protein
MKLNDIVSNATVIITGTINDKMEMISGILENNMPIFNKFKNAVLMLNVADENGEKLLNNYRDLFDSICNINTYHLRDYMNLGWQFGTITMERTAYDFVSENLNAGAVLKVDFDIYLEDTILNIDVSDAEAMIMPSIGYATVVEQYNSDIDKLMELYDIISPQSTIYLILYPMNYLYGEPNWLNIKYKEWILNPIGNGPHHIGVACEPLLRQSFERNNFRIKNMISKKSFRNLLETIAEYKIVDPSAKNLFFSECGICHLYDDKLPIIKIN